VSESRATPARPSYDPAATLGGFAGELERLEAQAEIAWGAESALLRELGLAEATTVLEVGCGSGALLARLAAVAGPAARLIGIDHDPRMLAAARERPELAGADLREGDALALALPDASVDFVVARLVLQHLADPIAALREMRRVLRPGGTVAAIEVDAELWGVVEPRFPELAPIQAKVWRSQQARGGDRSLGRRLWRLLHAAGFARPTLRPYAYHSDELGLDAFAPILSADAIAPSVADGTITPREFATVASGYRRFRESPDAFVMLCGLIGAGTAPRKDAACS
jgi:SAM-dependent methyltransferase